jgi:two-component system, cell cycle sensor histidine kinase and response regulator CckA
MRSDATDLTSRGTVLLVENVEEERARNALGLKSSGYTVIEAGSGIEALEELGKWHGHVDVVITDVLMPEMDGLTLMKLVKAKFDIKVIVLSTSEDAFDKNLADPKHFNLLAKPFTPKQLAAVVKKTIAG